jgi:OOP family OmpA-OmpF porin
MAASERPAPPAPPAPVPQAVPAPPKLIVPPTDITAEARASACQEVLTRIAQAGQIRFAVGSAELDRASLPTLDHLVDAAKACPGLRIEIAGHASSEGSAAINQQLSNRRAHAVVSYLVKAGVEAKHLEATGYGATRPIAPNDTEENMARNRRIEFVVRPMK